MPASKPRRIYFDANVFLAYISDEPDRADIVQSILAEGARGEIEIITSVVTIAEVAYGAEESQTGLNEEGEKAIDELWLPKSPVTLVDVSETLSRKSRSIIRAAKSDGVRGVRSVDALHLASAQIHQCDVIFTYEDEKTRARWQQLTNISVTEPVTDAPQLGI